MFAPCHRCLAFCAIERCTAILHFQVRGFCELWVPTAPIQTKSRSSHCRLRYALRLALLDSSESGEFRHVRGSRSQSHCFFMVKWGLTWGFFGYMKILRGFNMCGIEANPIYVEAALIDSSTP